VWKTGKAAIVAMAVVVAVTAQVAWATTKNGTPGYQGNETVSGTVTRQAGPPVTWTITTGTTPPDVFIVTDPQDIKPTDRRDAIRKGLDLARQQADADNEVKFKNGDCGSASTKTPPR